jgi:hypothetical protein
MEEIAMMNSVMSGTKTLAVLVIFGVLAAGAYAQPAAAAATANPAGATPDTSQAGSGGSSVSDIGEPPSPVSTVPLLYPKLAGIWAGQPQSQSLSEKFNQLLPPWLRFSGEFRERFEGYSGGGFKPNSTNDYDLQRIRLGMQIKPTHWLQFFIEMQDARVFGITPALPPYQNTTDIRQAYVQLGNPEGNGFTLQGGRFEMTYGNNRLIGNSWWTNVSRTFDGVRAAYQQGRFRLDAFATSVVIVRDGVIDHHLEGNNLYGLYATARDVIPHATFDVYEFWNVRPSFALQGLKAGHLSEWTSGFRWVGALPANFDYRTEMAYQLGTLSVDRIRAWMGHWVLGYTFKETRIRPRLFVEYDYGSGSPNDKLGVDNTFDPIYPSTHDKLGLADQFGWRNIKDLRFGQEFKLARKWTLATSFHDFWLANAHDALYPTRGSVIAQSATGVDGTHVGEELDIQAIYTPTRQTQIDAGYGHVFTGEFLNKATKGVDYSYPYMQIEYVF